MDTSLDEVYLPCSDMKAIPSSPSQLEWKIGLPWAKIVEARIPGHNLRIPPQLEKKHVVPTSSQDEAVACYSVSKEVPCSALKCETVPDTLRATPKVPRHAGFLEGNTKGPGTTSSEPLLPS